MYLPLVKSGGRKTRRQVVEFGGLDRTQSRREGALEDCAGLSSRAWPCLVPREGRTASPASAAESIFPWDELVMVSGGWLFCGQRGVGPVTPGRKQFAVVRDKLCVFPDKKYLERGELVLKDLEASLALEAGEAVFTQDGLALNDTLGAWEMYRAESGGCAFLDGHTFKVYDQEAIRWDPVTGWDLPAPTYKQIRTVNGYPALAAGDCLMMPWARTRGGRDPECSTEDQGYADELDPWGDFLTVTEEPAFQMGSGQSWFRVKMAWRNAGRMRRDFLKSGFQPGDTVTLSGCVTAPENNGERRLGAVTARAVTFEEAALTPGAEAGEVRLARSVPDLDYICSAGDRLVGVSGRDRTVYLSALGDPRNFRDYRGTRESSARLPVGSAGEFTGCAAYGGGALFFQEDCVHRLMGDRDGNFTLYTDQVAGLQAGSERSLAVLDETLYYKGREGVYAYTGSVPRLISGPLGNVAYQNAAAGSDGRRYYISMERTDTGAWELLVYDSRTGLWLKEEDRGAIAFAQWDGALYMLSEGMLYTLGQGERDRISGQEAAIPWEATFTPFTEGTMARKRPSRLLLRLELGEGAWAEAALSRDGGPFRHIWTGRPGQGPTVTIPIRPGQCDAYRLRLRGEGRCLVRTLEREFTTGGRW